MCVWALVVSFRGGARHTLSGTVSDAATGELLETAAVAVLRGGRMVAFALSNEKGDFVIPLDVSPDTLTLSVSMMGYAPFAVKIGSRTAFDVRLTPAPLQLKEAVIRPGRIWGRSDTLRYDASKFLRENDRTVEDLMKRLPGIQVDDDGNIRYRGKEIGTMYVEGLDLMGSRYRNVSRNLQAESVKEVEVLDSHQRIKSLAGKVSSDIADINIKLKEEFKERWSLKPALSAGLSADGFLYEADAGALRIARASQSLYTLKLSDTGNGITGEAAESSADGVSATLPDYRLLQPDAGAVPLKERRRLFDDAAIITAGHLQRPGEDARLKVNLFYTQDHTRQETRSATTFFNSGDTLTVDEENSRRRKVRQLDLSADYEDNAATHYLRNRLDLRFGDDRIATSIAGTYNVTQRQRDESVAVQHSLTHTRTLAGGDVRQVKSTAGYRKRSQQLHFDGNGQTLEPEVFYLSAESGQIIRRTAVGQHYTAGASMELNSLRSHYRLWITPAYEYLFRTLTFRLSAPLQAIMFTDGAEALLMPGMNFRTEYKINYAWNVRLSAQYGRETGDMTMLYRQPYFTDHRTLIRNEAGIPVTGRRLCSLHTEYRNTLREFFVTASLVTSDSRVSHTQEQSVDGGIFRWIRRHTPHRESSYGLNTVLSKGFYEISTKLSFEASGQYSRSGQIRAGAPVPYTFGVLVLKPTLSISPTRRTEVTYSGELQRQQSSFGDGEPLSGLWNVSHRVTFYYGTGQKFDLTASAEYFRNEISPSRSVNLLFVDLVATYKFRRVTVQFQLYNLLNHRDYRYTLYQPLSVHTSRTDIRPREALFRVTGNI
jgi:hypothetical protein